MPRSTPYGGQAVLEGVMIRGPHGMTVACRRPNGSIIVRNQALGSVHRGAARRVPLLRGVLTLWETLSLGARALFFSSTVAQEPVDACTDDPELPERVFWGSILVAIAFAAGLFFAAPLLLAGLVERPGLGLGVGHTAVTLIEGALRAGILAGYVALISRIPGIRRVFQYHGAEHMAVHAHEAGLPLTLENVRRFPKEHTRCGTSFLVMVMIVALAAAFAVDFFVQGSLLMRAGTRVALMIPVAAVSYELLRLGARFSGNLLVRLLFSPNIALQRITTRTPDDEQIEVAIASLEAALALHAVPVHMEERLVLAELDAGLAAGR